MNNSFIAFVPFNSEQLENWLNIYSIMIVLGEALAILVVVAKVRRGGKGSVRVITPIRSDSEGERQWQMVNEGRRGQARPASALMPRPSTRMLDGCPNAIRHRNFWNWALGNSSSALEPRPTQAQALGGMGLTQAWILAWFWRDFGTI